jgi:hypothetical protein
LHERNIEGLAGSLDITAMDGEEPRLAHNTFPLILPTEHLDDNYDN